MNDTSYVCALHYSKVNRSLYQRILFAGQKPHGIRINELIPWGSITGQQTAVSKYNFARVVCHSHNPFVLRRTHPSPKTSCMNYITTLPQGHQCLGGDNRGQCLQIIVRYGISKAILNNHIEQVILPTSF